MGSNYPKAIALLERKDLNYREIIIEIAKHHPSVFVRAIEKLENDERTTLYTSNHRSERPSE